MSSNLSNPEILYILLEGRNLDDLTSSLLMQRWLNEEISAVQTGAFLSALRVVHSAASHGVMDDLADLNKPDVLKV